MSEFPSWLRLNNVLVYVYTTLCSFIHPSMAGDGVKPVQASFREPVTCRPRETEMEAHIICASIWGRAHQVCFFPGWHGAERAWDSGFQPTSRCPWGGWETDWPCRRYSNSLITSHHPLQTTVFCFINRFWGKWGKAKTLIPESPLKNPFYKWGL